MVRIMTDGTSDIPAQRAAELGVDVLPLRVCFGEETFLDGVDITREEFYIRLAQSRDLPTTSQLNPDDFLGLFQKYADQGDQVVGIFVSSQLSGTCQSARIARDMVEGAEIYIVDSRTVTFAMALLVEEAAAMRDRGLSAGEMARELEALTLRLRLLAVVDTLFYLKKGGRISAAAAAVGGLLGIKPIVGVDARGTVEAMGKARSMAAGFRWIAARLREDPADPARLVGFAHSNAPEAMKACREAVEPVLPGGRPPALGSIGAVVGTHVGPGAAGVAYFVQEGTHGTAE